METYHPLLPKYRCYHASNDANILSSFIRSIHDILKIIANSYASSLLDFLAVIKVPMAVTNALLQALVMILDNNTKIPMKVMMITGLLSIAALAIINGVFFPTSMIAALFLATLTHLVRGYNRFDKYFKAEQKLNQIKKDTENPIHSSEWVAIILFWQDIKNNPTSYVKLKVFNQELEQLIFRLESKKNKIKKQQETADKALFNASLMVVRAVFTLTLITFKAQFAFIVLPMIIGIFLVNSYDLKRTLENKFNFWQSENKTNALKDKLINYFEQAAKPLSESSTLMPLPRSVDLAIK